jgi:hypothetical protein
VLRNAVLHSSERDGGRVMVLHRGLRVHGGQGTIVGALGRVGVKKRRLEFKGESAVGKMEREQYLWAALAHGTRRNGKTLRLLRHERRNVCFGA